MLKKILLMGMVVFVLFGLFSISVNADQVDYCDLYGVGCPDPDEEREKLEKEGTQRKTTFDNDISFRNAGANGDTVKFIFKGENWTEPNMKIELFLIPLDTTVPAIKQEMKQKVVQVITSLSGTVVKTKHEASLTIDTRKNTSNQPIYYKIQVVVNGQSVFISDKMFTIAGQEKVVEKEEVKPVEKQYNWSNSGINVAVNGTNVIFPDQKPLLEINTSRTYVPVRFLAESLGAEVSWDEEHSVVVIKNNFIEGPYSNRLHYLKIGENKFVTIQYKLSAIEDAYVFELPEDIAPVIVNGRTMLPFRYVAELLGSQVYYDKNTNTAHCVKRDMSLYNGKAQVISTVIGDYFVEELKEYRRGWYGSNYDKFGNPINNISFNGTYGDISTWAAFDHLEHPEWKTLDTKGTGHMHLFSNSLPEETSAYDPYARKYFNDQRQWSVDQTVENGVVLGVNETIYFYGIKPKAKAQEVFADLSLNWGIFSALNDEVNKVVHLYDEITYREISRDIIYAWDTSAAHGMALWKADLNAIGISIVGEYVYYNAART